MTLTPGKPGLFLCKKKAAVIILTTAICSSSGKISPE